MYGCCNRRYTTAMGIAVSIIVVAGITVGYVLLLAIEMKKGVRFGKKIRHYLDKKVVTVMQRVRHDAASVSELYERGSNEVEKDLIDPITKPIIETQQRYTILKTGEREIKQAKKERVSPYLQELLNRDKKKKKKKKKEQAPVAQQEEEIKQENINPQETPPSPES